MPAVSSACKLQVGVSLRTVVGISKFTHCPATQPRSAAGFPYRVGSGDSLVERFLSSVSAIFSVSAASSATNGSITSDLSIDPALAETADGSCVAAHD